MTTPRKTFGWCKSPADSQILRKDVLSPEEIQRLIACHYDNENPNVRRAFIFCLYCGLRFCDVKDLTYKNIDYANKLLKFEQNKTKGHSASSGRQTVTKTLSSSTCLRMKVAANPSSVG